MEVKSDVDTMKNVHFTKAHMVEGRKNMNIVYHISLSPVVILSQEIKINKHPRDGAKASNLARAVAKQ